ncbi:MAG TPA: hypothetical protein VJ044_03175 [Candidatus Hodarchaeales archaeon]|nr:hypothetical protein [Candidatus Hodarchaeales archaeon]
MKHAFLLFCVFIFVPGIFQLFGQEYLDPQGSVRNRIMTLINARYGADFQHVGYSMLDSLIFYSKKEQNERIQDPYQTLEGCILFSTYRDNGENEPDAFIAGMIKEGRIIWDNAPGTHADLGGSLLYAQDINGDKRVELLVSENDREYSLMSGPSLFYLYVLSWDGSRGALLSASRRDGKSSLIGDGGFELTDGNGDGIKEITASLPNLEMEWGDYRTTTFPRIVYSWNGKQYGFWSKSRSKR